MYHFAEGESVKFALYFISFNMRRKVRELNFPFIFPPHETQALPCCHFAPDSAPLLPNKSREDVSECVACYVR